MITQKTKTSLDLGVVTTQDEHCDVCGAEIAKERERVAFPQFYWTFYRKAKALFRDHAGDAVLGETWQGKVLRCELCQDCGETFDAMVRGFFERDQHLLLAARTLEAEASLNLDDANAEVEARYLELKKSKEAKKK